MDSATQRCLDGMRKIQRNDKEVDSAWVQTYYEENCGQVSFISRRFYDRDQPRSSGKIENYDFFFRYQFLVKVHHIHCKTILLYII